MDQFRDRFLAAFGSRRTAPAAATASDALIEPTGALLPCLQVRAVRAPDRSWNPHDRTNSACVLAALAVLVSAYVHLREWLDGMRHVHVIGPLSSSTSSPGSSIAGLLLTWKHWLAPFLAFGFGASTLGGFAIATTSAGLFGDHEKWQGSYVWLAATVEVVAIVAGLYAVSRELRSGARARAQHRRRLSRTPLARPTDRDPPGHGPSCVQAGWEATRAVTA